MTPYRWLSEAEARRRFPHNPKLWDDVQDQTKIVEGIVVWSPHAWVTTMLGMIGSRHCCPDMAARFRAAEEAMRVEESL